MKKITVVFLILILKFIVPIQAQEVLKKWKNIEKVGWKQYTQKYWYSYYSSDSSALVSNTYDSLHQIESLYTYYGNSMTIAPYDSSLIIVDYKKNGPFIEFYENQKVKSIENYFYDVPIGRWISYFPNGQIETIENYPNDSCIYLLCEDYDISVSYGFTYMSGLSSFSSKAVPHGERIEFYPNGNFKARKFFHLGLEIGKWEWYYENGIKKVEGGYYEGYLKQHPCEITVVDDPFILDNDEEIYSAGNFVHIRPKHGIWKYWDEKGNLIKEEQYDQGKLIQPKKKSSVKKK